MIGKSQDWKNIFGRLVINKFAAEELEAIKTKLLSNPEQIYEEWKLEHKNLIGPNINANMVASNIAGEAISKHLDQAAIESFQAVIPSITKELSAAIAPLVQADKDFAARKERAHAARVNAPTGGPREMPEITIDKKMAEGLTNEEWIEEARKHRELIDKMKADPNADQYELHRLEKEYAILAKGAIASKLRIAKAAIPSEDEANRPEGEDTSEEGIDPMKILLNEEKRGVEPRTDPETGEDLPEEEEDPEGEPYNKATSTETTRQHLIDMDTAHGAAVGGADRDPAVILEERELAGNTEEGENLQVQLNDLGNALKSLKKVQNPTPEQAAELAKVRKEMAMILTRMTCLQTQNLSRKAYTEEEWAKQVERMKKRGPGESEEDEAARLKQKEQFGVQPLSEQEIPEAPALTEEDKKFQEEWSKYKTEKAKNPPTKTVEEPVPPSYRGKTLNQEVGDKEYNERPIVPYDEQVKIRKQRQEELIKAIPETTQSPAVDKPMELSNGAFRATDAFHELFLVEPPTGEGTGLLGPASRTHGKTQDDSSGPEAFKEKVLAIGADKHMFGLDEIMQSAELSKVIDAEVRKIIIADPYPKKLKKSIPAFDEKAYAKQYTDRLHDLFEGFALSILKNNSDYTTDEGAKDHEQEFRNPMHDIDKRELMDLVKNTAKSANRAVNTWKKERMDDVAEFTEAAMAAAEEEFFEPERARTSEEMHSIEEKKYAKRDLVNKFTTEIMKMDIPVGNRRTTLSSAFKEDNPLQVQLLEMGLEPEELDALAEEIMKYIGASLDQIWDRAYNASADAFGRVKQKKVAPEMDIKPLPKQPESKPTPDPLRKALNMTVTDFLKENNVLDEVKTILSGTPSDIAPRYTETGSESPVSRERTKKDRDEKKRKALAPIIDKIHNKKLTPELKEALINKIVMEGLGLAKPGNTPKKKEKLTEDAKANIRKQIDFMEEKIQPLMDEYDAAIKVYKANPTSENKGKALEIWHNIENNQMSQHQLLKQMED